jgi:hypothetical protein
MKAASDYVAPASYEDLHRDYFPTVVRLVAKAGVWAQNVDDVAMGLMVKFLEIDILGQYRPQHTYSDGTVRSVKFTTFLTHLVLLYTRHPRHRLNVHYQREINVVTDQFYQGEFDPQEEQGPSPDEVLDRLEYVDMLYFVSTALGRLQASRRSDLKMDTLFLCVADQIEQTGKINVQQLALRFSVSATSIRAWLKRLEEEVHALGLHLEKA